MPDAMEAAPTLAETWTLLGELYLDGLVAALVLAAAAAWLGTHLVLRRMPFLGLAIPGLAGAGTALAWAAFPAVFPEAFAAGDDHAHPSRPFLIAGSAAAVAIGLVAIAGMARRGRTGSLHAAIVFLAAIAIEEIAWVTGPYPEMAEQSARRGRLLTVLPEGRDQVIVAAILALLLALLMQRRLWATAFDPDLARLNGMSPSAWLLVTLALVGLLAAPTVPEIGTPSVLAMLLVPPAILNRASPSLSAYGPLSAFAGLVGAALAFQFAIAEDWPLDPTLVLGQVVVSSVLALLIRLVRRRRSKSRAAPA